MTAPSLTELLRTWQSWSYRDLLIRGVAAAESAGDTAGAERLRRGLAREPDVDPLAALAANHELTRLLRGWQWHAIRAARAAGATWSDIGRAVGTTAEEARAGYLDHIGHAEAHGAHLTDTTPYRAVLDDPLTPEIGMGERPAHRAGVLPSAGEATRGVHR